jgi:hypothetical protein
LSRSLRIRRGWEFRDAARPQIGKSEHDYGKQEQETQREAGEGENTIRVNSIDPHGLMSFLAIAVEFQPDDAFRLPLHPAVRSPHDPRAAHMLRQ